MKLALILLLAPLLSAQIFYPPGSVRRYAGTPTAGDCTASAIGRRAVDYSAIPSAHYKCSQTSSGVYEWEAEGSGGGSGGGDITSVTAGTGLTGGGTTGAVTLAIDSSVVTGAASLTRAGACVYVASSGTLAQGSPGCHWDATNNRLGLGTASPVNPLHVLSGSAFAADGLTLEGTNVGVRFGASGAPALFANGGLRIRMGSNPGTNNGTDYGIVTTAGSWGIGPSNTSPTGTLHVYDATASTGVTTLTVRAGAGQSSTVLQQWQSSAGSVLGAVTAAGALYAQQFYDTAVATAMGLGYDGVAVGSGRKYFWSSTTAANGSPDLGLSRSPSIANTLLITNGGATNYWGIGAGGIQCLSGDGNSAACDVGTTGARLRNITAAGNITGNNLASANVGAIFWSARSQMTSPADGQILLRNSGGTDFGLLQFGGTTSSFPALKRSTTSLEAKLADDSAYTSMTMSEVHLGGAAGTDGTWRLTVSGGSLLIQKRESGSYVTKQTIAP